MNEESAQGKIYCVSIRKASLALVGAFLSFPLAGVFASEWLYNPTPPRRCPSVLLTSFQGA